MRLLALTLVAWLCGAAGPTPPLPFVPFDVGKAFSLKVGQTAQTPSGDWIVGFDGVPTDSRCPKGAQCVWAGDATVRVWLQRASGPREVRELHTATGVVAAAGAAGLRLVRLDPHPVAGRDVAPRDYVATLLLTAGPAGDADR